MRYPPIYLDLRVVRSQPIPTFRSHGSQNLSKDEERGERDVAA